MGPDRPRRAHWERSRSDGSSSSSDRPPEYVHPLDLQAGGETPPWEGREAPAWQGREAPAWEAPAPDPFEPPQTTRLVPVGPSTPMRRRTDQPDWPDDEQEPTLDDVDDAQAPVFAAETMRRPNLRQPDDRARYVRHAAGPTDFAVSTLAQPAPRPPASIGDQPVGPTPPANLFAPPAEPAKPETAEPPEPETAEQAEEVSPDASPPWVSTSSRTVGAPHVASAAQPAPAEVVVRIELVIIDQAGRVASVEGPTEPAIQPAEPKAAPEAEAPAPLATPPAPARSSAPVRAAVRIVGVLALVGIGLFLVQLGAWLVR
jgi:hypothetical protein